MDGGRLTTTWELNIMKYYTYSVWRLCPDSKSLLLLIMHAYLDNVNNYIFVLLMTYILYCTLGQLKGL